MNRSDKEMSDSLESKFVEVLKAEKCADQVIITSLEKKLYDLKNLIEIGISLSSNLEFHNLVESILYSCIGQLFIERVAILLQKDIDVDSYYIHTYKGYDSRDIPDGVILEHGSLLVGFLEENPIPHDFMRLYENRELVEEVDRLSVFKPVLIVPMKSRDTLNGMLLIGSKMTGQPFEADDKEFLRNLARFSATAVENSRLYQMATHDRMTRLYIHHYFQERLLEEMKRSSRNRQPLALAMCDIDHFKRFNDTYGHQQGDTVLKHTARIISSSVRSVDIPARYGGEEFAIILPDTSSDEAYEVAERLRRMVQNYDFPGSEEPLHVTISIGITQFLPDTDATKQTFIERADRALYKSKADGRNRVTMFLTDSER
ncbi:MAG: diguanylate cyclase [Spirochaetota bacterium]